MPGWLQAILIAAVLVVASWLLLIVLARRLPPGVAKDLAGFLPDCVTAMRVLRRDPRVPRRARVAVVIAMLWVLSPAGPPRRLARRSIPDGAPARPGPPDHDHGLRRQSVSTGTSPNTVKLTTQ